MSAGATHRGRILLEQKRYADAEKYFREGLASDPNDAEAFYFLAVCQLNQDRPKEALETVERALEFSPEASESHALRSLILSDLERSREALAAAEEAIRLDPDSDFGFVAQAAAHLRRQNWSAAETSARRALELNPENSSAANQLAQALRLQNRLQESAEQTEYMLSQDAEDADTHATAGWVALQRSDHRKAEEHFLEALRLEPTNTNARSGLKESYKARSPFYRVYLKYCFFLLRFTEAQRWALVIGLLIAVRVGRKILPGPLSMTLLAAYLLFVLWAHVASPVGNFQLLLDRAARHALLCLCWDFC
jgi:tetratricopeptide (TPR) repeat protein